MKPASLGRLEPPFGCWPSVLTACEPRGEMASGSGRAITRGEPGEDAASGTSAPHAAAPSSSGPVPALRLKRKCQSAWTCSNPETASSALPKLRRGRAKIKFRPWMAQPLVVKEGDANLRLAADLPGFNWLENKLNQKQEVSSPIDKSAPSADNMVLGSTHEPPGVPLKIRILEKTSASSDAQPAQVKQEEPAESRWPLKKRFIRQEPDESRVSPSTTPDAETKLHAQDDSPPTLIRVPTDGESSPAQRGPVIIKNVLPPTPPASIELPSTASDADQDRPLDLSSKRPLVETVTTETATASAFKAPPARREDKAEVEIIAMTTRTPPVAPAPVRPAVPDFSPEQAARFARGTAELQRVPDKGFLVRPVREHTIQAIPHPDWNRVNPARPYQQVQQVQQVPLSASHANRAFALPPLRPLAQHWSLAPQQQQQQRHVQQQQHKQQQQHAKHQLHQQQIQQHQLQQLQKQFQHQIQQQQHHLHQQQRSMIVRPEVQLHALGPGPPVGPAAFVPTARFFHPKPPPPPPHPLATSGVAKKPVVTSPAHPVATLASDWALRSCVVCSRRADFRCAGCHGNAYCSTLCQARDWPNHSQLCQRNS